MPYVLIGGEVDSVFKLTVVVVVGSLLGLCQTGVHWITQPVCMEGGEEGSVCVGRGGGGGGGGGGVQSGLTPPFLLLTLQ